MKIEFADSFWVSIRNMVNASDWWHWRFYRRLYYDIKSFLLSAWRYSFTSTKIKSWDFTTIFPLLKKHLQELKQTLADGWEVDETLLPKVAQLKRAIEIIEHQQTSYFDLAEQQLGYKLSDRLILTNTSPFLLDTSPLSEEQEEADSKIYKLVNELEESEWKELWTIISENGRGWWD